MSFKSSDHIDNQNCVSLLLQILEDEDELYPVFYLAVDSQETMSLEHLVALSQGLAHAKNKIESIIEMVQNG